MLGAIGNALDAGIDATSTRKTFRPSMSNGHDRQVLRATVAYRRTAACGWDSPAERKYVGPEPTGLQGLFHQARIPNLFLRLNKREGR